MNLGVKECSHMSKQPDEMRPTSQEQWRQLPADDRIVLREKDAVAACLLALY